MALSSKNATKRRKRWLPSSFPFSTMFSTLSKHNSSISATISLSSANAFNFSKFEISSSDKEMNTLIIRARFISSLTNQVQVYTRYQPLSSELSIAIFNNHCTRLSLIKVNKYVTTFQLFFIKKPYVDNFSGILKGKCLFSTV